MRSFTACWTAKRTATATPTRNRYQPIFRLHPWISNKNSFDSPTLRPARPRNYTPILDNRQRLRGGCHGDDVLRGTHKGQGHSRVEGGHRPPGAHAIQDEEPGMAQTQRACPSHHGWSAPV